MDTIITQKGYKIEVLTMYRLPNIVVTNTIIGRIHKYGSASVFTFKIL